MKELLVPAGNMECLYQAIFNGCDAVYVGGKDFGARKFANNFSNDELVEAIKLCHLYGVKIYATMNTLIKEREVDSFLKQIEFLYKNGIDAVLIQDFGMLCLIRGMFPKLEIHASTQANVCNREAIKLFKELGVKRVVLPREMSLEEIESIDVEIEKEVFVHGALCVSYSGCCLMSSMIGSRSANRGECSGCCRLKYTLMKDDKVLEKDKYLLSCKELNTTHFIKDLMNSSIDSFKIEGRMKSPLYVGFITRLYRKLIDGEAINLEVEEDKLRTIFNREFTKGHLFLEDNIINKNYCNHIGLEIGKVIKITKDKIYIKLFKDRELHQFDAIRFLNSKSGFIVNYLYDENLKLVNTINDICVVDNKVKAEVGEAVNLTMDYKLNQELKGVSPKKIKVNIDVFIKEGHLIVKITDRDGFVAEVQGSVVELARNSVTSEERVKEQIRKLGNTPFEADTVNVNIGNDKFISIKELNDLRNQASSILKEQRENRKIDYEKKDVSFDNNFDSFNKEDSSLVRNEEQLLAMINLKIGNIYVDNLELYRKYKDLDNTYFKAPRNVVNLNNYLQDKNLVDQYFNYKDYDGLFIGGYGLNVYNSYTVYYLKKLGLKRVCLSVELSEEEIEDLISSYEKRFNYTPDVDVLVYGKVENMVIKGNILNLEENVHGYSLVNDKGLKFNVYFDGVNTIILNYINRDFNIKEKIGKRSDFYDEEFDM